MKKNIYRASVFFAIIGLTLMYLSTIYLEVDEAEIGDIERNWAGNHVEIDGAVVSVFNADGNSFMDIEDSTGSISVADFDSETEVDQGDRITVTGRVDIYEGSLQVIAEEIVEH